MRQSSFFSYDLILFGTTLFLILTGILFIYSSGVSLQGEVYSKEYERQILWAITGIIILILFSFINHKKYLYASVYIYILTMLLLIITLFFGKEVNGARSWLGTNVIGIQPSEFSKIAVILTLGSYLSFTGQKIRELKRFLLGFLIILLPFLLVMLQPDMGTALVFFPIFFIMSYLSGAKLYHLIYLILTGFLTIILSLLPSVNQYLYSGESFILNLLLNQMTVYIFFFSILLLFLISLWGYFSTKDKIFYWIIYASSLVLISIIGAFILHVVLKEYQIKRLIIFLNPNIDTSGAGYHINQSITAIGNGGFWGMGFLNGSQSHLNYLPQQSTDFIFSILAEEWGFIGGTFIILLFAIILFRGIRIISLAKEDYSCLIGSGIVAMIFFHILVNIGMTMGIMPITGIPLLFLSHGGSSLWTASIGVGILLNIYLRRYRY